MHTQEPRPPLGERARLRVLTGRALPGVVRSGEKKNKKEKHKKQHLRLPVNTHALGEASIEENTARHPSGNLDICLTEEDSDTGVLPE